MTIVINPTAGSPVPLSILRSYLDPCLHFAIFRGSHPQRTNCFQLTDPRRDGGLGWPACISEILLSICSSGNRTPDLRCKNRSTDQCTLTIEPRRHASIYTTPLSNILADS